MAKRQKVFLILAAVLLMIIGLAASGAALALFFSGQHAAGITAGRTAVLITATAALIVGIALTFAGVMAVARMRLAWPLGIAAIFAFVAVSFVGNYVLFAEPRLIHSGTNLIVAALAIWLLSKGRPALGSDPG